MRKTPDEDRGNPKQKEKAKRTNCDSDSEWSEVDHPEDWKGLSSSWTCESKIESPPNAAKIREDAVKITIHDQLAQLQNMQDKLHLELALLTQTKNTGSSRTRPDGLKIKERVNKP